MSFTLTIDPPSDKQRQFLRASTKYVAFGGARGGGKSWSVRTKSKLLALQYPGIEIMIVRRTYPELVNNHINILRSECSGIARYSDKDKVLRFSNGSAIHFMYCSSDSDLDRVQGLQVHVLFLDEGTMLSEYQFRALTAIVRSTDAYPKRVYVTCNPGGVGHNWVRRLFVDRRYEEGEDPADYTFIQSLVTDNKALMDNDPEYIKQLEALPDHLKQAWLYGRWDIFEGMFFEQFRDDPEHYLDRKFTHVIEPFEIPGNWPIYRSFDWGYNRPFSTGYWTVDPDGVIYRILEFYGGTKTPNEGCKWPPSKVFEEMAKIEGEHRWLKGKNITGVADPAIWDAQYGESIAETAAKYRIYFGKGDHQRIPGWLQVQYRLMFDTDGFPMMYVFRNCKAFIRTIPLLMFDEHKPEDIDTDGEDHVADETRYFCMSRPIRPRLQEAPDRYGETPQAMFLDIPKEDIIQKPRRARMEVISGN